MLTSITNVGIQTNSFDPDQTAPPLGQICVYTVCYRDILNELTDNIKSQLAAQEKPGRVVQSVTCLTTDAPLTADPGVTSSIPAWSHTFVEIDHEIISTIILLPSADSFKKGCCQLQAKVWAQITG